MSTENCYFKYSLKEVYDNLSFESIKFAKKLKIKLMEGNFNISDKFYKGYDIYKKKFAEHLLSNEKVAEHDDFGYNILVDYLVPYNFRESGKLKSDEEFEIYIEELILSIIAKGESMLYDMYYEGETQMFMYSDGDIFLDFEMKEKETELYIYAYYKFLSK